MDTDNTEDRVVAIRADVAPKFDDEFEFVDWFTIKLRRFVETRGHGPKSIALVMADDDKVVSHTWTPDKSTGFDSLAMAGLAIGALIRYAADR